MSAASAIANAPSTTPRAQAVTGAENYPPER
jgi:hypothetical protein